MKLYEYYYYTQLNNCTHACTYITTNARIRAELCTFDLLPLFPMCYPHKGLIY